jgi:hypothetical protein
MTEEDKNATLNFTFYPEHYPDVDLTFHCNEDLSFQELLDFFRRFALAMSFSPQTVKDYLGED